MEENGANAAVTILERIPVHPGSSQPREGKQSSDKTAPQGKKEFCYQLFIFSDQTLIYECKYNASHFHIQLSGISQLKVLTQGTV